MRITIFLQEYLEAAQDRSEENKRMKEAQDKARRNMRIRKGRR